MALPELAVIAYHLAGSAVLMRSREPFLRPPNFQWKVDASAGRCATVSAIARQAAYQVMRERGLLDENV